MRIIIVVLAVCGAVTAQFKCPELKGFYPDREQCDLYYACVDGQAEERLCKDGLMFKDDNPKKDFCDIPANVDCGDRTLLREYTHLSCMIDLPISLRFLCGISILRQIYLQFFFFTCQRLICLIEFSFLTRFN